MGRDTRPVQGDIVNVRYEGKLDDETVVDKHDDLQMVLGDADVIQGTVHVFFSNSWVIIFLFYLVI